MDGAKVASRQHADDVDEDQGRHAGAAAAVRRRRRRRHGRGDTRRPQRAEGASGTPAAPPRPASTPRRPRRSMRAKARIRTPSAMAEYKIGDAAAALGRRRQDARSGVLVRILLPRADGADERRRQGFRGRPVGGNLDRHAVRRARCGHRRRRAQDHAGQDQDPPAPAGRRLRPAHLAGRCGRRRRCSSNITKKPVKLILTREDDVGGGAAAADDASRHEGRARRQGQSAGLASPPGGRRTSMRWRRRRGSRPPAARTTSERAALIRPSMRSRTCRPNTCARSAACGCTPGAASARATTSLRRVVPRRGGVRHRQGPAQHAAGADQGPAARPQRDHDRGGDVRLHAQAARTAASASRSPITTARSPAGVAEVSVDKSRAARSRCTTSGSPPIRAW